MQHLDPLDCRRTAVVAASARRRLLSWLGVLTLCTSVHAVDAPPTAGTHDAQAAAACGATGGCTASSPITYADVGAEGASFVVQGTRLARFGNVYHSLWQVKTVTGEASCTRAFFGSDPVNPAVVWGAPKICQVATTELPASARTGAMAMADMPGMAGAPYVDRSAIPPPSNGADKERLKATTEQPAPGGGEFRTVCRFSHMSFDDPIVYPGKVGASHLHTFFGNGGTDAGSTPESVRTSGTSTCGGGTANRSAYWVPTMIDTRDGTPLVPKQFESYYKNSVADNTTVQNLPVGLRMIAGSHLATSPQKGVVRYKCIGGPKNQNDHYGSSIPNCDLGADMWQEVFFPQCWNGKDLDSPDHKSHMAYVENVAGKGYQCPASHPVPLPAITLNVIYGVYEKDAPTHWRLSSDKYPATEPGGYSSHGDWFNGWDEKVSKAFVEGCIQNRKDCHAHLIGDGRMMN